VVRDAAFFSLRLNLGRSQLSDAPTVAESPSKSAHRLPDPAPERGLPKQLALAYSENHRASRPVLSANSDPAGRVGDVLGQQFLDPIELSGRKPLVTLLRCTSPSCPRPSMRRRNGRRQRWLRSTTARR
jgi:hypothetical protein